VQLREGFLRYAPIGALVGVVLLVELGIGFTAWQAAPVAGAAASAMPAADTGVTNTHAIGLVLYTKYFYLFQAAGLVLLVAMIGAIVLTLRQREGVRRQSISAQVGRRREETLEVRKVQSGSGV
jgi:NADH-quinone oxidoreductase subunit J